MLNLIFTAFISSQYSLERNPSSVQRFLKRRGLGSAGMEMPQCTELWHGTEAAYTAVAKPTRLLPMS